MTFQIGDIVKCIDHEIHLGAIGEVVGFSEENELLLIKWTEHEDYYLEQDEFYELYSYRFELAEQITIEEKICNKIKLMHDRWLKFQNLKLSQEGKHHV